MKNIKLVFVLCSLLFASVTKAQLNQDHPSVSTINIVYKAMEQSTLNYGSGPQILVIPESTVTLKQGISATKIYFKILNATDNSVVYEVNYFLNSPVVTNGAGKKLFENSNDTIYISNGNAIPLKPYRYEVFTQDAQSNSTIVFSAIQ